MRKETEEELDIQAKAFHETLISQNVSASGSNELLCAKPEDYYERNLKILLEHLGEDQLKGVSYIQRVVRIGYNQACRTIEHGIEKGVLIRDTVKPYLYRLNT